MLILINYLFPEANSNSNYWHFWRTSSSSNQLKFILISPSTVKRTVSIQWRPFDIHFDLPLSVRRKSTAAGYWWTTGDRVTIRTNSVDIWPETSGRTCSPYRREGQHRTVVVTAAAALTATPCDGPLWTQRTYHRCNKHFYVFYSDHVFFVFFNVFIFSTLSKAKITAVIDWFRNCARQCCLDLLFKRPFHFIGGHWDECSNLTNYMTQCAKIIVGKMANFGKVFFNQTFTNVFIFPRFLRFLFMWTYAYFQWIRSISFGCWLWSESLARLIEAVVCLLTAVQIQLSHRMGTDWLHNALQHCWLMPINCHLWDCESLSISHASPSLGNLLLSLWSARVGG